MHESIKLMNLLSEQVACVLESILENTGLIQVPRIRSCGSFRCFNSMRVPEISIGDYFLRFQRYAKCSDSCYVLAFIYLDRLLQNFPDFKLTRLTVHRLLLATIVLAIKYLEDYYSDNIAYAKIGGVSLTELNSLESNVLLLLHYNLYVDSSLYRLYIQELELEYQRITGEKSTNRKEEEKYYEVVSKPMRGVLSMTSMKTIPSTEDFMCDQV